MQIDLVYLHNAGEMQLAVLGKTKFLARLLEAFIALEQMRSLGHIR